MKKLMMAVVAVAGLAGCGVDLCAKQADCAQKAGIVFSETECRNDNTTEREKAASAGCTREYDAAAACISNLSCTDLTSANGIAANCGAKLEDLNDCL